MIRLTLLLLLGSALYAQTAERYLFFNRVAVGLRVRVFALDMVPSTTKEIVQTSPPITSTYTTWNKSSRVAFGPTVEVRLSNRVFLSTDFIFQRARYEQQSVIEEGNNKEYDTTYMERTKLMTWDVPILLHIKDVKMPFLPKMMLTGGVAARIARNVQTGTEITYRDDTTDYNEVPTPLKRSVTPGVVAGIGWRAVDGVGLKVTPEVRYTRWFGAPIDKESTRFRRDQVEVLFGFTF